MRSDRLAGALALLLAGGLVAACQPVVSAEPPLSFRDVGAATPPALAVSAPTQMPLALVPTQPAATQSPPNATQDPPLTSPTPPGPTQAPPPATPTLPGPTQAPPTPVPPTPTALPTLVLALDPSATPPERVRAADPPPVTADYVAVVDEATGALLYGAAEHARVAPASITKIATTLVALEHAPDLDAHVDVTISGAQMAARGSSIMGIEPGDSVSITTLLYGMMLPSGNDAAEQVATSLAPSRSVYVGWMNARVAALGLIDTQFVNPSGLDANGHYSSAFDMAYLAREAMRNETFRTLAAAAAYRGDGFRMATLNRLIGVYAGADGVKIGSTRRAGKTMVASATRGGHRVYVAVLHSTDLPGDTSRLLDWVWRTFTW